MVAKDGKMEVTIIIMSILPRNNVYEIMLLYPPANVTVGEGGTVILMCLDSASPSILRLRLSWKFPRKCEVQQMKKT